MRRDREVKKQPSVRRKRGEQKERRERGRGERKKDRREGGSKPGLEGNCGPWEKDGLGFFPAQK